MILLMANMIAAAVRECALSQSAKANICLFGVVGLKMYDMEDSKCKWFRDDDNTYWCEVDGMVEQYAGKCVNRRCQLRNKDFNVKIS